MKTNKSGDFPFKKLVKENKRIQQIGLVLILLTGLQATVMFFIKDITFSREVGIVSFALGAFSIICFLLFLIPSYRSLNSIDPKDESIWLSWRNYQQGQINRFWLLYPGISAALIGMVNLTYDEHSGTVTKFSGAILVSIAAVILIRNYYLNAYIQNRLEADRVLMEAEKTDQFKVSDQQQ